MFACDIAEPINTDSVKFGFGKLRAPIGFGLALLGCYEFASSARRVS